MSEPRRALILGVTNCAGRHLAAALLEAGWAVVGTRRADGAAPDGVPPQVQLARHQAGDGPGLRDLIAQARPATVYFLLSAGRGDGLEAMLEVAVRGLAALCEALLATGLRPVVVAASSSAVYGTQAGVAPLAESAPLLPLGPYGLGKALAEEVAAYYARRHALAVRIARPFNHPGPGERPGLALADYCRRIVAIEHGEAQPRLTLRGATNVRDFVDVRDVVAGYLRLAERGRDGEAYNLCSGVGTPVGDLVARLVAHSRARIELAAETQTEPPDAQVGDPTKAEGELGWTRRLTLDRTLSDMLDYARTHP